MAANDLIKVEGTELILESAGAALTDGSFAQADNDTVAPADNAGYPLLDFEFQGAWATATGINNGEIRLYSRKINFEGASDAPAPSATYPRDLVGSLVPDAVTTTQNLVLEGAPRSLREEQFWIENATGQALSANWTLKAYPVTHRPSAT